MSFIHSNKFKYLKNLVIGLGASVVLIGALGKINSEPWGGPAITAGLLVEAFLFAMLGILPPEKDYYWEKLYPGLDKADGKVNALGISASESSGTPLNGEVVQDHLQGMLSEMRGVNNNLGALKALQEVDFSQTGDQLKTMNNFYQQMNDAMSDMVQTSQDVKVYKENIASLNSNLSNLNQVYGNMLNAMSVSKKG